MSIRVEKWHPEYYIIVIDDELYPTEIDLEWKPPLIAHWGKDIYGDINKEKLMYVWYPKNKYTEKDIEYIIFTEKKYDSCPMCVIGRDIISKKLRFKYPKTNIKNINKKLFKREKKMKISLSGLKSILGSGAASDYIGQGLIQIPKFGISMVSTDLGNKLINGIAGIIGNVINERYNIPGRKKDILRAAMCNMMFGAVDPTANQLRSIKRSGDDMLAAIKYKQFGTAFGTLLEEPQTIISALREWIPSFGKGSLGATFKSLGKSLSPSLGASTSLNAAGSLSSITPKSVTVYSPDKGLSKKDLVAY